MQRVLQLEACRHPATLEGVLNAELMLMIYDPGLVAWLAAEQERYFASCRLLTLATWQARSLGRKFAQNLARLLSPLL